MPEAAVGVGAAPASGQCDSVPSPAGTAAGALPRPAFFHIIADEQHFSTKKARRVQSRTGGGGGVQPGRTGTGRTVAKAAAAAYEHDGTDTDENTPPGLRQVQSLRVSAAGRPPPLVAPRTAYQAKHDRKAANILANTKSKTEFLLELVSPYKYDRARSESYFNQLFEVEDKIGQGSFGEVFRVRCREDGVRYAVKRSLHRYRSSADRLAKLTEVNRHKRLAKHCNLVQLVRAWEQRGRLYMQSELCHCSLAQYAERHNAIAEATVCNYFVDMLHAVAHLHDNQLLHMDIKPENILLSHDGICKLGDLGLVFDCRKLADGKVPEEGDSRYLAPEVLTADYGTHNDIFSLGMTMLELSTDLYVPNEGQLWQRLRDEPLPQQCVDRLSPQLLHIFNCMLMRQAHLRPSAHELLRMPPLCDYVVERGAFVAWRRVVNSAHGTLLLAAMVVLAAFYSMWLSAVTAATSMAHWLPVGAHTAHICKESPKQCGTEHAGGSCDRTPVIVAPGPAPVHFDIDDEDDEESQRAQSHRHRQPSALAQSHSGEEAAFDVHRRRLCFARDVRSECARASAGSAALSAGSGACAPHSAGALGRSLSPIGNVPPVHAAPSRRRTIRSQRSNECLEHGYCPKRRLFGGSGVPHYESCTDTDDTDSAARVPLPLAHSAKRKSSPPQQQPHSPRATARPPPSPIGRSGARTGGDRHERADCEPTTDSGCETASTPPPGNNEPDIVSLHGAGGDACSPPATGRSSTPVPQVPVASPRPCSKCSGGKRTRSRKRRMPNDSGDAIAKRLSPNVQQRIGHYSDYGQCSPNWQPGAGAADEVFHSPLPSLSLRTRTVDRSCHSAVSPSSASSSYRRRANNKVASASPSVRGRCAAAGSVPAVLRRRRVLHSRRPVADDGHESDDERDGPDSPDAKAARLEPSRGLAWHTRHDRH